MSEHSTAIHTPMGATLSHGHDAAAAHGHHGPKNPVRTYALTLITLLILTIITVVVAQFDLGEANVFAAIAIATVKATVVALFFMHLLHDRPMNSIILCTALVMLGLLLAFGFMDTGTRQDITPQSAQAPAGRDFNRPEKLGEPYLGEKKQTVKPAPLEPPR
jgi:cytochrome c oxidase subunit IV